MAKILLVTMEYPPNSGGVGHYYQSLVEHMPRGSVTVLAPATPVRELGIKNSELRHAEFFWWCWPRWGRLAVELIRVLRREHYDWIAIGQVLPIGPAVIVANVFTRFYKLQPIPPQRDPPTAVGVTNYKLVVFCHGMDIAHLRGRKRWLARWVLKYCNLVIANSQFTKRAVAALGISRERIQVLTPCPAATYSRRNLQTIPPQRDPPTAVGVATYNLQPPSILSVGRLVKRKGFDTVLRVYAKLQHEHPTLELKIIGDGPDRQRLESLARDLHCDPAEIFLGAMEPEAIAPWYDRANVFLLLPRDEGNGDVEGFGMVFLEANAHGVPVVAGSSGGVPEAVIDGQTGYLVDPLDVDVAASRVRALLNNESLHDRLGQQGRARVQKDFHWQDRAQQLEVLLTSAVIPSRARLARRESKRVEGSRYARHKISVIIPVYNHAAELSRCIASLRAQTRSSSELIIVDDGSTDESAAVAEQERRIGGPWQRCEVITQPNAGAPNARNAGFGVSTGSFVLFSDADIQWRPDALEKLSRALEEHRDASYAYSSFYFGWKLFRSGSFDPERLKGVNYIHTSSLIRREHFSGFDPSLKKFQDWDLWLSMLEREQRGVWVQEPLFQVEPRRSGMSRWYPSFMYTIPWQRFGIRIPEIERYGEGEAVIRRKHHLEL